MIIDDGVVVTSTGFHLALRELAVEFGLQHVRPLLRILVEPTEQREKNEARFDYPESRRRWT